MTLCGSATGSQHGVSGFIVIGELQLVMLIVLKFIPDRRSSKTCMWTVVFLKVGEPVV